MAQQLRKNWQMGLHEYKKLLHTKGNGHQTEETAYTMGENLCQLYIWKRINNIIYKELKKLNSQRINNSMKKWTNDWTDIFLSTNGQKKPTWRNARPLATKEMQIKSTFLNPHFCLIGYHQEDKQQQMLVRMWEKGTLSCC
jgi:fructosamine-3-kinase